MNKNLSKPSVHANKPEWVKYLSQFMPRKEADKIALDVRNKLILKGAKVQSYSTKSRLQILKEKYPKFSKVNQDLARKTSAAAHNSNSRVKNWICAKAKCVKTSLGAYDTINAGTYKGKYKGYTIWNYQPVYTSYYRIGPNGKKLIYVHGFDKPEKKIISAPKGMLFIRDENGLMLQRSTDKMDYHLSAEELLRKDFATHVRKMMATNYSSRMSLRRNEKLAKIKAYQDKKRADWLESIFKKDLKTTMVTLNDSRKAGNCVEGSLQFAERRLGIPRQEILNGGHLFFVRAEKLVKTGDQKAINAAKIAWQRETTICI